MPIIRKRGGGGGGGGEILPIVYVTIRKTVHISPFENLAHLPDLFSHPMNSLFFPFEMPPYLCNLEFFYLLDFGMEQSFGQFRFRFRFRFVG